MTVKTHMIPGQLRLINRDYFVRPEDSLMICVASSLEELFPGGVAVGIVQLNETCFMKICEIHVDAFTHLLAEVSA